MGRCGSVVATIPVDRQLVEVLQPVWLQRPRSPLSQSLESRFFAEFRFSL